MSRHRYALPSAPSGFKVKPWIGALVVALACPAAAQAAVLGHSRLASALGQPLRIDIQVSQLSPEELNTLTAKPAAAADWAAAGLTPPVADNHVDEPFQGDLVSVSSCLVSLII
jgi:pilus assembly protein FimV